ncbi:MAG: hypothetical protein ACJAQ3_004047 [Planctomycetota bacterium]
MMNTSSTMTPLRKSALKGLLWMDYQRHREGILIGLPSIALMAIFIGLFEDVDGPMFFWTCLAMAIGCGIGFGRSEWTLGVEEYSLGLPPSRKDRYYVRFGLGIGFMLAVQFMGLAAGPFGWVSALGEMTSIQVPHPSQDISLWAGWDAPGFYMMCVGASLAIFAECYAVCMNSENADTSIWSVRIIPFIVAAIALINVDYYLLPGNVGILTGTLGLIYTLARTLRGARQFESKDMVMDGPETGTDYGSHARARVLIMLGLLALLGLGFWTLLYRQ